MDGIICLPRCGRQILHSLREMKLSDFQVHTLVGPRMLPSAQRCSGVGPMAVGMVASGMSGGEIYDRLKSINPHVKMLLCSGYSMDGQAHAIFKRGCDGFIQKPFKTRELSRKLREILDQE